uniref:Uncharacterized protein n=1 Tax=Timema monikensis TaxID=170555 RepID=A0A7R9EC62_9NEOP|nr:unnamed protein product [Timema monikensis]
MMLTQTRDMKVYGNNPTGQQEYSSRQAGVTTGIIAAVLVPILLVLVSDPIVRHSEFDSDDLAPYKRNSDDSNTFKKGETEIQ